MEIDNDFTEKEVEGEETREWKKRPPDQMVYQPLIWRIWSVKRFCQTISL
jgi:hypothetical protein